MLPLHQQCSYGKETIRARSLDLSLLSFCFSFSPFCFDIIKLLCYVCVDVNMYLALLVD